MVFDGAGWLGGIAVATGYVLVVTGRITADARTFQVLNIVGGMLLTATTIYRQALPNTVINVVWIVFGTYALLASLRRRRAAAAAAKEEASVAAESWCDDDPVPAGRGELVGAR